MEAPIVPPDPTAPGPAVSTATSIVEEEGDSVVSRPDAARRASQSSAGGPSGTAPRWPGLWQRRVGRVVALVAGLLVVGVVVLWLATPSGDDLTGRVQVVATSEHATVLASGEVPPLLAEAVVATEDERFYQHHGIDVIGLGRALLYDVTHLCACQGGSTITQQLVKDVYLGGSDGGVNKLADMALAFKVELRFNKQQILADYLSVVPTGFGRYGMANAACADFHRPLTALDLGQLALLAGMPQAPSAYDPLLHPDLARARRAAVLDAMVDDGYITSQQANAAGTEAITLPSEPGGC